MTYRLETVLFALLMALAWATGASAQEENDAVDTAGSALAAEHYPWYDPATDDLRPLHVAPPAEPPEPNYPDWEWNTPNAPSFTGFQGLGTLLEVLLIGLLVLVFVGIIAALIYYFMRNSDVAAGATTEAASAPSEADRIENLPFPVRRPQGDLLDEARRQYEAGNYNEAIVYLYSYELVQLDRHQHIRLAQGKTNRQYLREVRPQANLCSLLERTMVAFEDVFFGHHPLSREQFEVCWNSLDRFHSSVETAAT